MSKHRHAPRHAGSAIAALADTLAPKTTLAEVQRVWVAAVGETIAREAQPTAERGGVLTVTCSSSVWSQELDLMGPELVAQVNDALGATRISDLRCRASAPRSWAREELP